MFHLRGVANSMRTDVVAWLRIPLNVLAFRQTKTTRSMFGK